MSDVVIRAEGLGKKYLIGHLAAKAGSVTLRDVITRKARGLKQSAKDMILGQQLVQGDEVEAFWALKDVAFTIKRGDVVGVIGRNGAGKSTLLKVLSRITEPTVGRVEILGRIASLLEVGTGFHPELTGRENIYLNGAILGMSRAEIGSKFDEIVDFAGIERFLDTPVKRYSSGMYVRLAFGVAAHLDPEILIVDEVLAVGDAEFQKKCLGKMRDVAGRGRTVLFVSHNMSAIRTLCHNAIMLNAGRIEEFGDSATVINNYIATASLGLSADVDLSQISRVTQPDPRIGLTRLSFTSALPFQHGGSVRGSLGVQVKEPINDVAFGIGFSTPDGLRLLTYDSDLLAGGAVNFTAAGLHWIDFTIESLPLPPGAYAMDIGCRQGGYVSADYLPSAVHLEVSPGPATPPFLTTHLPCVRLPSEWRLG